MRAGRMDRRIQLQSLTVTKDADGNDVESWSAIATVWAEKRESGGKEAMAGDAVQADIDAVFRIYYRTDVLTTSRVVYESRTFDIQRFAEIGRHEGLEILCKERRAAGPE